MAVQRMTRQRTAIGELMDGLDQFRSAQQIHVMLAAQGQDIGLATVYRTLNQMAGAGEVDVLRTENGEALFRQCAQDAHHHHLVCKSCGRTVEVDGPGIEEWAQRVAADNGFSDVSHTVELFGTCAECARRAIVDAG